MSADERSADMANEKKHKQTNRYQAAIVDGWVDARNLNKTCPQCKRLCVLDFDTDYMSLSMHTKCGMSYDNQSKRIRWQPYCDQCANKRAKNRNNTYDGFTTTKAIDLAHHLDGKLDYLKDVIEQTRARCANMCASCGIHVISAAKSGWMQESFNMVHPNLYVGNDRKSAKESHIAVSCLACNAFQNNYPWNVHVENLIALSNHPPAQRNNDVSHIPFGWVDYCGGSCKSSRLKRELLARDGKYCAATGIELSFEKSLWNTVSVDRINNAHGYTLENCRLVAAHINYVKNFSIDEVQLQAWIARIRIIGEDVIRVNCARIYYA